MQAEAIMRGFELGQAAGDKFFESRRRRKLQDDLKAAGDTSQDVTYEQGLADPNSPEVKARVANMEAGNRATGLQREIDALKLPVSGNRPAAPTTMNIADGLQKPSYAESQRAAEAPLTDGNIMAATGLPARTPDRVPATEEQVLSARRQPTQAVADPMAEANAARRQARVLRDAGMIAEASAYLKNAEELQAGVLREGAKTMFQQIQAGDYTNLARTYNRLVPDQMEVVGIEPGEDGVTMTIMDKITGDVNTRAMSKFQLESLVVGIGQDPYRVLNDIRADEAARMELARKRQNDENEMFIKLGNLGINQARLQETIRNNNAQLQLGAQRNSIAAQKNRIDAQASDPMERFNRTLMTRMANDLDAEDLPKFQRFIQLGVPPTASVALVQSPESASPSFIPGQGAGLKFPGVPDLLKLTDIESVINERYGATEAAGVKRDLATQALGYINQASGIDGVAFRALTPAQQDKLIQTYAQGLSRETLVNNAPTERSQPFSFTQALSRLGNTGAAQMLRQAPGVVTRGIMQAGSAIPGLMQGAAGAATGVR